jgi:hypothetical protein
MKNNMILMLAAVIALFTLAIALYGAGALLLGQRPAAPAMAANETGNVTIATDDQATAGADTMKTAFDALSVSSADPAVKAWIAGKKIVYVASISSDFCEEGLSDMWTVTFASDDGQIMACVVQGEVVDTRLSVSSPQQGLDPSKAIDSVKIWQKVASEIQSDGGEWPEVSSMTLKVAGGSPRWDVSYETSDGFHIMRVDAGNGTITDKATIGQG